MNLESAPVKERARLTEDYPLVVGIDLGGTQIRTAVLRGGTLLSRVSMLNGDNPTPDRIIPRMFQSVQQALTEAHVSLEEIKGIGIGAPGPLDSRTGVVFCPPNLPGWGNVPLRDIFEQEFHIPVYLENDANAAALGEYLFGAGQGCNEMVYVTVSTGVGGGVISRGKILEGVVGTAGELGHMTIDWRGERCNCGNIGCLESIASGTAIARRANKAIALGKGDALLSFALKHQQDAQQVHIPEAYVPGVNPVIHVTASTVAQAAAEGIPLAREIILHAAEGLGVGLVNIIHIFNPAMIIIGGGVTKMGDLLMKPALRVVNERAMKVPRESTRIVLAQLDSDVGLIGAGALTYYHQS